jgi:hypothetical protein
VKMALRSLVAVTLFIPATVSAQIDVRGLCAEDNNGTVGAIPILYNAVTTAGLSPRLADWNRSGATDMDDWVNAIFDPTYCATAPSNTCKAGDQNKLNQAREMLMNAINISNSSDGIATKFAFTAIRAPSVSEAQSLRLQSFEEGGEIVYDPYIIALDPKGRFAVLSCPAQFLNQASTGQETTPIEPITKKAPFNGFRLSSTVDGLSADRLKTGAFALIPSARISYADDGIAKTRTFEINAIVGFDFSTSPNNHAILYAGYEKKRVRANIPDSASNASQVSAGFNYGALLESLNEFSLSASYNFDTIEKSKIGALRATWRPGFLQQLDPSPFGIAVLAGPSAIKMDAQAIAIGGHVFAKGASAELGPDNKFLRAGGEIKLTTWPLVDSPLFDNLSLYTSYKHLLSISGPKDASWYTVGGEWALTERQNFVLSIGYEKGDDEDFLTPTDKWTLGLGLKF